jgi:CDP-glucose 4,6-dehydratase
VENMEMKRKNKFWKNKKVLITGHEGFLGSWLTKILMGYGAEITGVDKVKNRPVSILKDERKKIKGIKGDISDFKLVDKIIKEQRPAVIFHLAAEAIVADGHHAPVNTFKSNIEGTWNILEAARDKKFIKAIVAASSDKAYGSHKKLPYNESAPLQGAHPYDVSKSCADLICFTYHNTYNLPVCVTRCGNIYGPGDHNFSRLIPDFIRRSLEGKTFFIRSDGKFVRDYVYVEDIAMAYITLAEKMIEENVSGEAFNFSNEEPLSVLAMIDKIYKVMDISGKKNKLKILNKAKYEIKKQYLCAEKARKILGWKPHTSIEAGILRAVDWYKDNLNVCGKS